jgi:hypothetical protein
MAAWRARSSYLVEAIRFFLPVIVQRDSAHMLTVDLEQGRAIFHLTALCGVAAMLYLSALERGIVTAVLGYQGVVQAVVLECCC